MGGKLCLVVLWRQNDWGIYNRRNEALFHEMAQHSSVEMGVHIEPISIPRFLRLVGRWLSTRDANLRRVYRLHLSKALRLHPVSVEGASHKYVASLFVLYPGEIGWLTRLNERLLVWQCAILNRFLDKHLTGMNAKTVLVAYPPSAYLTTVTQYIAHDLLIADIVDDVIERFPTPEVRAKMTGQMSDLLPTCRRVYSTSPLLQEKYGSLVAEPIVHLPNGVSIDRYQSDAPATAPFMHTRPTIGYVGVLNLEIDCELLEHVVESMPEFDVMLVGNIPTKTMRRFLRHLQSQNSNLILMGPRHFSEVPAFLKEFDVLISLKKANHTTAGNDSMKIYEYLATGKPIVSTSVPPAPQFKDIIYVADAKEEFVANIPQAAEENDLHKRQRRIDVAREHSWSKRADRILCDIENLIRAE